MKNLHTTTKLSAVAANGTLVHVWISVMCKMLDGHHSWTAWRGQRRISESLWRKHDDFSGAVRKSPFGDASLRLLGRSCYLKLRRSLMWIICLYMIDSHKEVCTSFSRWGIHIIQPNKSVPRDSSRLTNQRNRNWVFRMMTTWDACPWIMFRAHWTLWHYTHEFTDVTISHEWL